MECSLLARRSHWLTREKRGLPQVTTVEGLIKAIIAVATRRNSMMGIGSYRAGEKSDRGIADFKKESDGTISIY